MLLLLNMSSNSNLSAVNNNRLNKQISESRIHTLLLEYLHIWVLAVEQRKFTSTSE